MKGMLFRWELFNPGIDAPNDLCSHFRFLRDHIALQEITTEEQL